jgi:hypothetical protein
MGGEKVRKHALEARIHVLATNAKKFSQRNILKRISMSFKFAAVDF